MPRNPLRRGLRQAVHLAKGSSMEPNANHKQVPDPRASRGGLRVMLAAGNIPGGGPARFARHLLARHGAARLPQPPADLQLRPPARRAYVERRRAEHYHTAWLVLHVHPRFLAPGGERQQPVLSPEMRWAVRVVPGASSETVVERFVSQITKRVVREESVVVGAPDGARRAAPAAARAAPPVPAAMVYPPRAAAPAPGQEAPAVQPPPSGAAPVGRSGWPQPGLAQTPAVVDVRSLTDQVLQALDQRLIAGRERMGRSG